MRQLAFGALIVFSLINACKTHSEATHQLNDVTQLKKLPPDERLIYIAMADTWLGDRQVSDKDLLGGPSSDVIQGWNPVFRCEFVEPAPQKTPGGMTPKFECARDVNGKRQIFRIKYDPASQLIMGRAGRRNLEVWGEVLASRLLWALGFPADRVYPIRVECGNCPAEPWTYIKERSGSISFRERSIGFIRTDLLGKADLNKRETRTFSPALVKFRFDGPVIESFEDSGWSWAEIYENMSDPKRQTLYRDALTIIAAFIQHADNKAEQQRLVCRSPADVIAGSCQKPLLMIHDVGSTFGRGWAPLQGDIRLSKVDLDKWVALPLWNNIKTCEVNFNGVPNASLRNSQKVSEEARQFVADLFSKLTPMQIRDLFKAAQIEKLGAGSVEQWAQGFETKMQRDLFSKRCG